MTRDVFISHSAQDRSVAEKICAALEQNGIRCWIAPRDVRPGKPFPGEITRAIQQSKMMLLIFSAHSNSSEQVLREVQLAVDSHLPIVRLRIADIPLSDDLRYYLSTPHWLDALSHPLSKHIPPLVAAIKELLAPSQAESDVEPTQARADEAVTKQQPVATQQRAGINWKLLLIGLAIVAAGVAAVLWTTRTPNRPTVVTSPTASPQPTIEASPTATVAQSASPVATPTAVPSPTPQEPTVAPEPKASPNANALPQKAPVPRNNRPWQEWMDEFVHNYIASNETNDIDLAVSFYANSVDVFEEGRKSSDAIRQDIEGYNARWPSRRATIRGDVRLSEKAANQSYTASFEHDYYVQNASRGEWINGAVAVDLQVLIDENGIPRITSMKQKTLRKDKGTMQRR